MAEQTDVIRQQIDETRESLADKLETLEGHVKDAVGTVTDTIETVKSTVENTVESVKSGVESTVETVKSSLNDTVDSVKETFDLPLQVDRHPWGALGCSLLAGMAAGYLLEPKRQRWMDHPQGIPGMARIVPGYQPDRPAEAGSQSIRAESTGSRFASSLFGALQGEFDKVKLLALGAVLGIARDALKDALPPSLSQNVTEIVDDFTRRLGSEPIRGSVLESEKANQGSDSH
jgi:uncharacterized protein YjbJ (UPF0337 family)